MHGYRSPDAPSEVESLRSNVVQLMAGMRTLLSSNTARDKESQQMTAMVAELRDFTRQMTAERHSSSMPGPAAELPGAPAAAAPPAAAPPPHQPPQPQQPVLRKVQLPPQEDPGQNGRMVPQHGAVHDEPRGQSSIGQAPGESPTTGSLNSPAAGEEEEQQQQQAFGSESGRMDPPAPNPNGRARAAAAAGPEPEPEPPQLAGSNALGAAETPGRAAAREPQMHLGAQHAQGRARSPPGGALEPLPPQPQATPLPGDTRGGVSGASSVGTHVPTSLGGVADAGLAPASAVDAASALPGALPGAQADAGMAPAPPHGAASPMAGSMADSMADSGLRGEPAAITTGDAGAEEGVDAPDDAADEPMPPPQAGAQADMEGGAALGTPSADSDANAPMPGAPMPDAEPLRTAGHADAGGGAAPTSGSAEDGVASGGQDRELAGLIAMTGLREDKAAKLFTHAAGDIDKAMDKYGKLMKHLQTSPAKALTYFASEEVYQQAQQKLQQ